MLPSPDDEGESLIADCRIVVGLNHKGSSKWYTYMNEPVFKTFGPIRRMP